jgi:hypothetical protein
MNKIYNGGLSCAMSETNVRRRVCWGCALDPPPLEILTALKIIVSYLAVRKMPGLVADAISEGRRGAESRERCVSTG